jgi:hypothetical protein
LTRISREARAKALASFSFYPGSSDFLFPSSHIPKTIIFDSFPDREDKIHGNGAQNLKGATPFPCVLVIQLPTQKGRESSFLNKSSLHPLQKPHKSSLHPLQKPLFGYKLDCL